MSRCPLSATLRQSPRHRRARASATLVAITLGLVAVAPARAQDAGGGLTPAHRFLGGLVGTWTVIANGEPAGTATVRPRLDGRFIEAVIESTTGPVRRAIYTFGFDDRHDRFTVIAMDATGNYWVSAAGERVGNVVTMLGTDDDPNLAAMGITKEFVIALTLPADGDARIETRLVDNRTAERKDLPFFGFTLRRAAAAPGVEGADPVR